MSHPKAEDVAELIRLLRPESEAAAKELEAHHSKRTAEEVAESLDRWRDPSPSARSIRDWIFRR